MENATKALLIAAAVLIAIILIALGVSLLGSAGDTTGQAEQVGEMLDTSIGGTSGSVISGLQGLQGGSSSGGSSSGGSSSGGSYKSFYMYLSSVAQTPKEDWCITNIPSTMTWKDLIEDTDLNNGIGLGGLSVKFMQDNGYVYVSVPAYNIKRYVRKIGEEDKKISINSKIVNNGEYVFIGDV